MKAVWNHKIVAQANKKDLILIEGNWYFPPNSLKKEFFKKNNDHTTCVWKGEASYFDLVIDKNTNKSSAWYYPNPLKGSISRVKKDFTNYVAFWRGVEVKE